MMEEARAVLEAGVGPAFPGAVAVVLDHAEVVLHHAVGTARHDTIYDLASLTKPMVIGSLLATGQAGLDAGTRLLAGHASGLAAHRDFRPRAAAGSPEAIGEVRSRVLGEAPVVAPGSRVIYSDIGYMRLGWKIEAELGAPLDALFAQVAGRFGLSETGFCPARSDRIAPTEDCPVRGRVVRGEAHDLNCWYLGGVAGHAGLFGTAMEVARWGQHLLDAFWGRPSAALSDRVRTLWLTPAPAVQPGSWRLGFDSVTPGGSSAGVHFGPRAVGHLGFTGTSIWIEPDREWIVVLVSNRVHPRALPDPEIKRLRPRFHDAVARALFADCRGHQKRRTIKHH